MLELKTGVLYEYAGIAGASIGLGQTLPENWSGRIGRFARKCGTAFQLQDDILGIIGDERLLGKAVGSDIREGKRTTIVLHAFQNAGTKDAIINNGLETPAAGKEIDEIAPILIEYHGIEYTRKLAESIVIRGDSGDRDRFPIPDIRSYSWPGPDMSSTGSFMRRGVTVWD